MKNNEKISIVVPIYNVEEYLPRCLDSITAQTYTNIEIMLIDDGSPDNAGAICDEYAAKDDRIRVFHIANGGVAKARQIGVEKSIGEYIIFVDPDDWLPQDAVMNLYNAIENNNSIDIVIGSYTRKFASKSISCYQLEKEYTKDEYIDAIIGTDIIVAPWAKLFRRDLFKEDSFPNIKRSQDWLMNIHLAMHSKGCRAISNCVYYYDCSSNASSRNKYNAWTAYYLDVANIIKNILTKNNHFKSHTKAWALGTIRVISNKIKVDDSSRFDSSHPIAIESLSYIDYKSLPLSSKFQYLTLQNSLVRFFVRSTYKFKTCIKKIIGK